MTIGQNMKAIRESRNLTRIELSDLSGVHEATIKNMEDDRYGPGLYNAMQCAKALGVSLDEYVGWGRLNV